jgi:hypothetical protein
LRNAALFARFGWQKILTHRTKAIRVASTSATDDPRAKLFVSPSALIYERRMMIGLRERESPLREKVEEFRLSAVRPMSRLSLWDESNPQMCYTSALDLTGRAGDARIQKKRI